MKRIHTMHGRGLWIPSQIDNNKLIVAPRWLCFVYYRALGICEHKCVEDMWTRLDSLRSVLYVCAELTRATGPIFRMNRIGSTLLHLKTCLTVPENGKDA